MTLGERIVEARKGKGYTARQFSKVLAMSESGLWLYEHDRRTPMEAVLQTIARETGVSFRWLNSGQGDKYAEDTDIREAEDERIVQRLSPLEKETILKFLELDALSRRNIRVYVNARVDEILKRREETEEEG